jgi:S1-C subfamily serine protease
MVLEVDPVSPAGRASLLLGDVLLRVDGRTFSSPADLSEFLEQARGVIHLEFVRGGKRTVREVAVNVGAATAEAA